MGRRTLLQMIAECHKNRTVNHELKKTTDRRTSLELISVSSQSIFYFYFEVL